MSLKDWFRTRPVQTNITVDEWNKLQRTVGGLAADVERQQMVWESYRDELKTLVERWRKREERRVKKEATQEEEVENASLTANPDPWTKFNRSRGIG